MRVYYLTGALFALSNLALQRIKVARFGDLNDPFELLGIDRSNRSFRKEFMEKRKRIDKTKGLICFSLSWNNPLMWGHYAEKHTGMCLGFDIPKDMLKSVIYSDKLINMSLESPQVYFEEDALDKLMVTKFADWKYEREMRLVVPLRGLTNELGKYFLSFSSDLILREVVLGPRCELPIEGIRSIVAGLKPAVSVLKSRIAFTRFAVLRDKTASGPVTSA